MKGHEACDRIIARHVDTIDAVTAERDLNHLIATGQRRQRDALIELLLGAVRQMVGPDGDGFVVRAPELTSEQERLVCNVVRGMDATALLEALEAD